ncbi:di-trans,poly-cis-decaprenylcistransferase [Candidatus Saccharibacteria bacterium]|nr:di-trans,poly-cis-decaprenylcistransferase [Candidatus Saccharibacteria bacterium]
MSLVHLGIIADGNRRWAKENGLPKVEGHRQGLKVIEQLVAAAAKLEIPYITFYVFSTENWGREKAEVDHIMKLAETKILKMAEKMAANNIKLLILGTRGKVNPTLTSLAEKAEKITADCTGTTACFCFNYGGEQEIADAANIAIEVDGEITPKTIRKHLYHPEVPDLDMVVRTSGEERISGFMLWRAAYAELMFIKKYFPEMSGEDLETILSEYEKRNRRFGK